MKKTIKLLPIVLFIFPCLLFSQTSGIGEVSSIENKAKQIENNRKKITENKQKLPELEKLWKEKLQKLKDQLLALQKERDNLIADMKVGARCSECKRWKTELEKEGINFEQHLGEVKGYAIPATTPELEAIRKQYGEKMAIIKVQVQRLEKGDDAVLSNINDTDKLFEKNKLLCEEVTQHSKNYEIIVLKEAKSKQELLTQTLVDLASDYLIANDWVAIQNYRILSNQKEFQSQSEKIKQQLTIENKELIEQKNTEILSNEAKLAQLKFRKDSISSANDYVVKIENEIIDFKKINQSLAMEISGLDSGLSQKIHNSTLELKLKFDKMENDSKEQVEKEKKNVILAKKRFDEEVNISSKNNNSFVFTITEETNRIVIAGKNVECSIWNGTAGEVSSNWNQLLPCIQNLVSSNQINPYCSKWNLKKYLGKYLSFLSGLDAVDKNSIQKKFND